MQNIWSWLVITLEIFVYYVSVYVWEGKKQKIPPTDRRTDVTLLKATEIVNNVKTKKLKAIDVITSITERINAVNPIINAVTDERFIIVGAPIEIKFISVGLISAIRTTDFLPIGAPTITAASDAEAIDEIIHKSKSNDTIFQKPLLGVPFTVQESVGVRSMFYTHGLISRKHLKCPEDGTCVKVLKEAGAIPIAVTNVPEIDIWSETRNKVHGQTCNPYHTGRSVGGSGGAEAALIASLSSPFGICKDVAGSSLMAASYCGVFAYCPTSTLSNISGANNNNINNYAIIARNMDDLRLVSQVLCGSNNVNSKSIKLNYANIFQNDSKELKIRAEKMFTEIRNNIGKELNVLHLDLHDMQFFYKCWLVRQSRENSHLLTNKKGRVIAPFELVKKLLGLSRHTLGAILSIIDFPGTTEEDLSKAEAALTTIKENLINDLGSDGVLLLPAGMQSAPYHYSSFVKSNANCCYFSLASLLQFPAIQVPLGLNEDGLPFGIEVLAKPRNDALCIEVAAHLEKAFGGYISPCEF